MTVTRRQQKRAADTQPRVKARLVSFFADIRLGGIVDLGILASGLGGLCNTRNNRRQLDSARHEDGPEGNLASTAFFLTGTTLIEWLALALATVLAFMPSLATDLAAFGVFAAVYLSQRRRLERNMAPALSKTAGS